MAMKLIMFAFTGRALRKPPSILAIIIDHMVPLQLLHPGPTLAVQLRGEHFLRGEVGVRARGGSREARPDAAVQGVIPVGGCEWGEAPVGLH